MLGSEAMGAPPYKGEQRARRPHHLRARSRPNLPSYESLYGLSWTGLRTNASPEASAVPYGKSSRRSWEFIGDSSPRATVEGARRSPCKAESCTYGRRVPLADRRAPSSSLQAGTQRTNPRRQTLKDPANNGLRG